MNDAEGNAAILKELREIRAEQAEHFRLLKNKIASTRWIVNRMLIELEHMSALLDEQGQTPE